MTTPIRTPGVQPSSSPITSIPVNTPSGAPAIPTFHRVQSGFHPGEVKEVFMQLVSEITGLRGHVAHLEERLRHAAGQGVQEVVKAAQSPAGHQTILDLLQIAASEIEGDRAAAAAEVAKMISDSEAAAASKISGATDQASSILRNARTQAHDMMSGAAAQSATVLDGARSEAKGMLDQASAKAAAVELAAGNRQAALKAQHEETMARLRKIREVVGGVVDAEEKRGSLDDEVAKAMPAGMSAATSAPARVDAATQLMAVPAVAQLPAAD